MHLTYVHVDLQRSLIEAPEEEEAGPATVARLQTLRLTREEMGFKTVPLLPSLDSANAADLQARHLIRTRPVPKQYLCPAWGCKPYA